MEPPTLTTDRLVLEPLGLKHSAGMFLLWSRAEVCRYSGAAHDWDGAAIALPAANETDSDKIIHFFIQLARTDGGFHWALMKRDTDEFAGTVGFNRLMPRAELAFHLRPEFWGQGLMQEAVAAALGWLRQSGVSTVEAFIEPENEPSVRLAGRFGFASTGLIRDRAERFLLHL
jgi:ribosomal-protein-alanine N-acetyltransferase